MVSASLLSALYYERWQEWTRPSRVPSGAMEADRTTSKWGNKVSQTATFLGKWEKLQKVLVCGGAGGRMMATDAPERRGRWTKPLMEIRAASWGPAGLTPRRLPNVTESSLNCPEDNTPVLPCGCACVTGISFWRCTFGKTFSVGKAEWKHTASKRIPKALHYLFTDAFIIDEAPVGFPLPQTLPPHLSMVGYVW